MRKSIFILIIVVIGFSKSTKCIAQTFSPKEQIYIDSLNQIINNTNTPDTSLAIAYLELTSKLYESNPDTIRYLCNKVLKIMKASPKKNQHIKAEALRFLGYLNKQQGAISVATDYYLASLKIYEQLNSKKKEASIIKNIAYMYLQQKDYKNAEIYFKNALKLQQELHDSHNISYTLNDLGFLYKRIDKTKKALKYFNESAAIQYKINDKKGLAYTFINIGYIHLSEHNIDSVITYFEKSLKIQKQLKNMSGIAYTYSNMGYVYLQIKDYNKAAQYGLKSLKITQKLNDKTSLVFIENLLGKIYFKAGKTDSALVYSKMNLNQAKEIGYPENIRDAAELLWKIYKQKGEDGDFKSYAKAFDYYTLYFSMRDSINNKETEKKIAIKNLQYNYEKEKLATQKEQEKKDIINQEKQHWQTLIIISISIGFIVIVIFSFFLYRRYQLTSKQKSIIESQKKTVEKQKAVVDEKNQEILDSITYAKRIQSAILPPNKLVKEYLQKSFILYKPKDIVAGDFYWMESLPNPSKGGVNKTTARESEGAVVLFAAADCTGHGVPGAMVSVVCHNALNRSVREHGLTDPGEILNKTREIVIQEFEKSDEEVKDGMDIALCSLTTVSSSSGAYRELKYAGANNPLWIIRKKSTDESKKFNDIELKTFKLETLDFELHEVKANKQPIGKYDNPKPFITNTFELQEGDSIYIFSDGYVDQFGGAKGKKLKAKAFRELLLSIQHEPMNEQRKLIDEKFETWRGNIEQVDDVCIIGVKI